MKILIADDDSVSRRILESTLRRLGHEPVTAEDGLSALDRLQAPDAPQLAILDWMMPGQDGLTICREIRRQESYTYLILLTSRDSRDDRVAGLDAGADDFLTKPFDAVELRARLHTGERILDLQSRLLEKEKALRYQATHDVLTELWNRRYILDELQKELDRAKRDGKSLAVAVADLDNFKQVNDTYGHASGDGVLRTAAGRIRSVLRPYDSLGRFGGEEFLFLLPGCDGPCARDVAERARQAASAPVTVPGGKISVTLSLGVSWTGLAGFEPGPLVDSADGALYSAKREGRNRVVLADASTSREQPKKP
jgi:diguanylate cyclase (GGDEF)-like protein